MTGVFDIFITIDSNLEYQQQLAGRPVSFVVLSAKNNKYDTQLPLMSEVHRILETIPPGQVIKIEKKPELNDEE